MISLTSILTVTLRYLRVLKHDPNFVLAALYWPVLDILIMGFLGTWIQQSNINQMGNYQTIILLGLLLWQIVGRGGNIVAFCFGEELWNNNIVNMFSLPLRITEWMAGIVLFYSFMIILTTFICMLTIYLLFNIALWQLLATFFMFALPLFFCGIWIGFTCLQICISLGRRGMELGFVMTWLFAPFSGVYYPVEILPQWAQWISVFLPMSYAFQGMRVYLINQQDPTAYLVKAYVLSIIYAVLSIFLFIYFFNRSKRNGLARLTD